MTKTVLEMVNAMITSLSNAPVQSLDENLTPDVQNALRVLNATKESVLARGWASNTEILFILPNKTGEIILPLNVLKCKPLPRGVVDRGLRLYDLIKKTYTFSNGVYVKLCYNLEFDELPFELKDFIEAEAVQKFFTDYDGDPTLIQMYAQETYNKRAIAINADLRDKKRLGNTFTGVRVRFEDIPQ